MPIASLFRLHIYALDGCRVGEMNPTPAVAILVPQAMAGCLGRIFKASFVSPSCSKALFPSVSGEECGQNKVRLGKGKTPIGHV